MAPQYVDQAVLTFSSQEEADLLLLAAEEDAVVPGGKGEDEAVLRVVPRESARAARRA